MKKFLTVLLSLMLIMMLIPSFAFASGIITSIDFPVYHIYDCSDCFLLPDITINFDDGSQEVITEETRYTYFMDWPFDDILSIDFSLGEHTVPMTIGGIYSRYYIYCRRVSIC